MREPDGLNQFLSQQPRLWMWLVAAVITGLAIAGTGWLITGCTAAREAEMTVHRFGDACVVLYATSDTAAMAPIPCPAAEGGAK